MNVQSILYTPEMYAGDLSRDRPDSEKGPEYIAKMIVSFYRTWLGYPLMSQSGGLSIYGSPWYAQQNRLYMDGHNTGDNLRKTHQLNDDKANDVMTAMLIPWDPSMFQVKVMNILRHFLVDRDTRLTAMAQDPTSVNRRDMERFQRYARMKMAKDP